MAFEVHVQLGNRAQDVGRGAGARGRHVLREVEVPIRGDDRGRARGGGGHARQGDRGHRQRAGAEVQIAGALGESHLGHHQGLIAEQRCAEPVAVHPQAVESKPPVPRGRAVGHHGRIRRPPEHHLDRAQRHLGVSADEGAGQGRGAGRRGREQDHQHDDAHHGSSRRRATSVGRARPATRPGHGGPRASRTPRSEQQVHGQQRRNVAPEHSRRLAPADDLRGRVPPGVEDSPHQRVVDVRVALGFSEQRDQQVAREAVHGFGHRAHLPAHGSHGIPTGRRGRHLVRDLHQQVDHQRGTVGPPAVDRGLGHPRTGRDGLDGRGRVAAVSHQVANRIEDGVLGAKAARATAHGGSRRGGRHGRRLGYAPCRIKPDRGPRGGERTATCPAPQRPGAPRLHFTGARHRVESWGADGSSE